MASVPTIRDEIRRLEAKLAALQQRERDEEQLRAQYTTLMNERRNIDEQLRAVIQKLAGLGVRIEVPAGAGGRRGHVGASQKMHVAGVLYGKLRDAKGQKFGAGQMATWAGGLKVRELVHLWNERHKGGKPIKWEGAKKSRRYWVA